MSRHPKPDRHLVAAIERDLRDPILGVGSDEELARDWETTPAVVRWVRDRLHRDLGMFEILGLARELAALTGWRGSPGGLAVEVLRATIVLARQEREGRKETAA